MQITETRIRLINKEESSARGVASITIDDTIAVHNIMIRQNREGQYYINMPSRKDGEKWVDVVHPINSEARQYIQETILNSYFAMRGSAEEEATATPIDA